MPIQSPHRSGFTLVEILVVITIIITLSAAAISGSAKILSTLRFSSFFNKIVSTVQETRSFAAADQATEGHSADYLLLFEFKYGKDLNLTWYNKIAATVDKWKKIDDGDPATIYGKDDGDWIKILSTFRFIYQDEDGNLQSYREFRNFNLAAFDISNSSDGKGGAQCFDVMYLVFLHGTGEMRTNCPGALGARVLKLYVYETPPGETDIEKAIRYQSIIITRASGLIQIEKPMVGAPW